jgi:folate-binding protein YgfZ
MTRYITGLPGEASIHLRGSDIPRFLQGQLTCDLRKLKPAQAIAGAMCNVKGRVISDLWVVPAGEDHCILRLRRSLAEEFAENLERYARFSRITVEVDHREDAITGIYGDIDASGLPGAPGDMVEVDGRLWLRSGPMQAQCIDLDTKRETRPASLPEGAETGQQAHWQAETLNDGHYALEKTDSERFTPQALNYDESGRVAFDKGCYTGQEVVARLHYRGQSKKRLAVLIGEGAVASGDAIVDEAGNRVGECLRTEQDRRGRLLVAAEVNAAARGTPLAVADGRPLTPV